MGVPGVEAWLLLVSDLSLLLVASSVGVPVWGTGAQTLPGRQAIVVVLSQSCVLHKTSGMLYIVLWEDGMLYIVLRGDTQVDAFAQLGKVLLSAGDYAGERCGISLWS